MNESAPGSPKIPLLLTAVTAVLSILLFIFIQSTINNTTLRYTPWVDASMEIKLEATFAHLAFEKGISAGPHETIETVRQHLIQAQWFANAILDGGTSQEYNLLPLSEESLRQNINRLLYQLTNFQNHIETRYSAGTNIQASPPLNEALDTMFHSLLADADQLEKELKQHISRESKERNSLLLLLMLAIFSMALISAHSIWRFTQTRSGYLKQLSSANQRIIEQNHILQELAHTDQLTDLPNRKMLEMIAHKIIGQVQRKQTFLSVSFIDLDFFKPINDQYGHHVGDKVLIATSRVISEQLREGDTLARLAGDEFILLIQEKSEAALRDAVSHIFTRIHESLNSPVVLSPEPLHIRLSAGTALAPLHGKDFETLMHNADLAMYLSKEKGRGNHYFFHDSIEAANKTTPIKVVEAATE